ncbi:MATE family efflux transporter [Anaerotruncus colihominis]|uniref:Probable multidrug resistance protein NorM n=1 Tax=Anaerotruncus colihominis TaxID=169435 RepID=A0A1Y4MR25_9FIRM|nr:MATE family efflux transporter [Anaerotruncus colihominis]OUO68995.1 MATE family efflux transporter [Anaerotruncus colihominis]OUP71138.1 MATE family efflux transporter [Anaerotruncus colihominis]OUP76336.1 MATE family efflux transporter [Anaerotruncus colihominis]
MLDLTKGPITKSMLLFAGPMILGNLLQQLYNIADTLIVGQFLGPGPLAAVGSSFTLMTFLTSIILGLCMGSGVVFSMLFGAGETDRLKNSLFISFALIGAAAIVIEILSLALLSPLLTVLQVPADIRAETGVYLQVIFLGIFFTFIYNYFACVLRAIGNSAVPLIFLSISSVLNIVLDLAFIIVFKMGVAGAAWATIIAQGVSAGSIMVYCLLRVPQIRPQKQHLHFERTAAWNIARYSFLTCIQQSVMNFGILMIQGLVNSFGVSVMAAFAAAVKIDSFAYMPVQDFGNAFSTFIAQNYGAGKQERIRGGIRSAVFCALAFCAVVSLIVCLFARPLMLIFVKPEETQIIAIGMQYLRIEGACYAGIGCLFLLYGLFRGIGRPAVSIVLTVVSLGTRVALAYLLAPIPAFGLPAIWWAIPIGWFLADFTGLLLYRKAPRQKGRLSKQTV